MLGLGPGALCRGARCPHERPALRLTFRGTCAGSRGECPAFPATSRAPLAGKPGPVVHKQPLAQTHDQTPRQLC